MTFLTDAEVRSRRLYLGGIGALAGLAAYVLVDVLPSAIDSDRVLLFLAVWAAVGFGGTLGSAGPISPAKAAMGAGPIGLGIATLMLWASYRFDGVDAFLQSGHPLIAVMLMIVILVPFWIAFARPDAIWRDYETLFDEAWRIIIRAIIATIFTLIFWAIIALSNALLGVVGIGWIEELIDIDPVPFVVTGAVFGIGLAVVHEFAGTLSPYLPLRLLRLILPMVVLVTAIFLIALPFRGLSDLFGTLSAAATLIAMAATGISLVAIAIDRRDELAVTPGVLRLSARVMSGFVVLLGALSIWSVALRTSQHGWTPDRIAALTAALTVTSYGCVYAFCAIPARDGWMNLLRRGNVWLALGVALVAGLWLTPILNPQRIAANSQVDRFSRGVVSVEALDLWSLREEFGRAGDDAIRELSVLAHPEAERLAERIAALDEARDRFSFEESLPPAVRSDLVARFLIKLPVLPTDASVTPNQIASASAGDLSRWIEACDRRTPADLPGCLALATDLDPATPGDEVVVFAVAPGGYVQLTALSTDGGGPRALAGDVAAFATPEAIDRIVESGFETTPIPMNAITLRGQSLFVLP